MRTWIGGAAAAVVLLAGCGGGQEAISDSAYVDMGRAIVGDEAGAVQPETLLTIRTETCRALDATPTEAGATAVMDQAVARGGISPAQALLLVQLSVRSGCPQHEGLVG